MNYYADDTVTVHHGDCLDVLATLPDASVDAVVTDPPYGLEFMGKDWDKFGTDTSHGYREKPRITSRGDETGASAYRGAGGVGINHFQAGRPFQAWCELWAVECLRVLKPGGHLLAFGGTRTSHRLASAIEDAGFEIRDSIAWLYGQGFAKSLNLDNLKQSPFCRCQVRELASDDPLRPRRPQAWGGWPVCERCSQPVIPAGLGTALKPAHEPVVVARKPLVGTVAGNVLAHGTGALNVDGCRVEGQASGRLGGDLSNRVTALEGGDRVRTDYEPAPAGRWPANVVLDESQAAALDQQSGSSQSRAGVPRGADSGDGWGMTATGAEYDDSGGASRFFYCAKAPARERPKVDGVAHPTVKPLTLMRWLVRLVTPPGGLVLDPFAGSGATVEACVLEGFRCVAIEREAEYLPLILQRIHRRRDPVAAVLATGEDGGLLFDLLDEGEPA